MKKRINNLSWEQVNDLIRFFQVQGYFFYQVDEGNLLYGNFIGVPDNNNDSYVFIWEQYQNCWSSTYSLWYKEDLTEDEKELLEDGLDYYLTA